MLLYYSRGRVRFTSCVGIFCLLDGFVVSLVNFGLSFVRSFFCIFLLSYVFADLLFWLTSAFFLSFYIDLVWFGFCFRLFLSLFVNYVSLDSDVFRRLNTPRVNCVSVL